MRVVARFALISLVWISTHLSEAAEKPTEIDQAKIVDFQQRWLEQGRAIHSGEFEVELFQYLSAGVETLGGSLIQRNRMERFLAETEATWSSSQDNASIRAATARLPIPRKLYQQFWKSGVIRFDGAKVRNSFRSDLVPGAIFEENESCFDGNVDVHYVKESQQVDLTENGSTWVRFGLTHLCLPGPVRDQLTIVKSDKKILIVETKEGIEYAIDRKTGAVVRQVIDQGRSAQETVQFGFRQLEIDGVKIAFPSVRATTNYHDGKLMTMFLFVIKSAQLNEEIPPESFSIPIPGGTTAVYHPKPGLDAARAPDVVTRVDTPVEDARTLLPMLRERSAKVKR